MSYLAGSQDVRLLDCEDIVDDVQQELERGADCFPLADGDVSMKDLLQDFGVGHKALSRCNQALQEKLGLALVRMRRPEDVHRDVGVDEGQD